MLFPVFAYCQCDSLEGKEYNLGLYGGIGSQLTLSRTTNRLFCGTYTPNNFFYSDDSAKSWKQAYPFDSMFYECGERGWAGNLMETKTNHFAWVANRTVYSKFSSIQISYLNGDSGSFKTAFDPSMINYTNGTSPQIELTDYFLFTCLSHYIIRIDTLNFDSTKCLINIENYFTSVKKENIFVNSIAATNNSSGFPFLVLVDTSGSKLYGNIILKIDSNNYSILKVPDTTMQISKILLPQFTLTTDTIFIFGKKTSNNKTLIYRTFDGGTNWDTISNNNLTSQSLDITSSKIEYSDSWKNDFTKSNGQLIFTTYHFSNDLGNTWILSKSRALPSAMSYNDTSQIFLSNIDETGIYIANSFYNNATISSKENKNLKALNINCISQSKKLVYIATDLGIGYTNVYKNASVLPENKWKSPYGEFPISISLAIFKVFKSVEVSPFDSLHVIAGGVKGFAVTKTGPNNFNIVDPGFILNHTYINDIEFITDNLVFATDTNGIIWKSDDGGINWAKSYIATNTTIFNGISGFCNVTDTIIYAVSGSCADSGFLWKSIDLGNTWKQINFGPSNGTYASVPFKDVMVDPDNAKQVYLIAGCDSNNWQEGYFLVSDDGGLSFSDIKSTGEHTPYKIAYNNSNPDTVYIGAGNTILRYDKDSTDLYVGHIGLVNEKMKAIEYGSILVGSTTSFYSFDMEGLDNIITKNQLPILENEKFVLYPNPITDNLSIKALSENKNISINFYNSIGKEILQLKRENIKRDETIETNLSSLSSGVYLLKIKSATTTSSFKLLVK